MAEQLLSADSMAGQEAFSSSPPNKRSSFRRGRSANKEAASKIRVKANYSRKPSRAGEKDADRRMRALEKQISRVQKAPQESITSLALTEAVIPPTPPQPALQSSQVQTEQFPFDCRVSEGADPHVRERALTPEAAFIPTAARLRPIDRQGTGLSEELKFLISQTISQGVANTLHLGSHVASVTSEASPQQSHHYMYTREAGRSHGASSPDHSVRSRASVLEEVTTWSLHKAKATAQIGTTSATPVEPSGLRCQTRLSSLNPLLHRKTSPAQMPWSSVDDPLAFLVSPSATYGFANGRWTPKPNGGWLLLPIRILHSSERP
ncbi:hypothetical protein E2320_002314 [Naja naja]|nr:hypothetical protein E2320_002314 [Naja naja]